MKTARYRFENGSLYEYCEHSDAYIHVYKNSFCKSKAKAIRLYEEEYETSEKDFCDSLQISRM